MWCQLPSARPGRCVCVHVHVRAWAGAAQGPCIITLSYPCEWNSELMAGWEETTRGAAWHVEQLSLRGEEREVRRGRDGRDSGTETRGSRRGRVGPCAATGRRRAAENGGGRREKRNIGGIQEKKGCRERESLQLLFGVFIIYHLISRHLAECHWNALDLFHSSKFIQHFVKKKKRILLRCTRPAEKVLYLSFSRWTSKSFD